MSAWWQDIKAGARIICTRAFWAEMRRALDAELRRWADGVERRAAEDRIWAAEKKRVREAQERAKAKTSPAENVTGGDQ